MHSLEIDLNYLQTINANNVTLIVENVNSIYFICKLLPYCQ